MEFSYHNPTAIEFGVGQIKKISDLINKESKVLVVYGGGSIKKNGVYDEMKALLEQAGKKVVDFSGIMSNPTYIKVQEGAELADKLAALQAQADKDARK